MHKDTKTLEEMKDSRILYEKRLPNFGYIILLIVLILLITVIIWSIKARKIEVIKAQGTVESENKNYVMSPFAGQVTNMSIKEGKNVEKGDNLFTVTSTDLNLQQSQTIGQKEIYEKQIEQYEKLIKSIKDDCNYFDSTKEDDELYYNQFETYKSQIGQQIVDTASLKTYGYSDEQIKNEMKKNESKKTEIYFSTLKTVTENLNTCKKNLSDLETQLNTIIEGKEEYVVTANASGIIHMSQAYKEGMVVQAGTAIASIASVADEYIIQAYLDVSDMPRVDVGNEVEIAMSGLVQNVYGTISGEVIEIDSDITMDSENKKSYFKVRIKPDINYLVSKHGRKVNISNGMQAEARIQYDEITYFEYVMEALGVVSR